MMDLHDEREEWISVMTFGVRDVRYYTLLYNTPFPLSLPWKSLVLFVVAGRVDGSWVWRSFLVHETA